MTDKMSYETFDYYMDSQFYMCKDLLQSKREEYAGFEDAISNFRKAAHIQGISIEQALLGMMAKHTVSIYDMIGTGDEYAIDKWREKITDNINYLIILYAIVSEKDEKKRTVQIE